MDDELRLYCLMRTDLGDDITGKLMVQAGHAFVSVMVHADPELAKTYFENSQPKIVLKAKNQGVINRAAEECRALGLNYYVVVDAGRTVFPEPTVTCMGIGPVRRDQLPKFVAKQQLFL